MRHALKIIVPLLLVLGAGCSEPVEVFSYGDPTDGAPAGGSKADSSAVAVFLDFEWDGELSSTSCWNPNQTIESQVLYTVGQLNGQNSVGRLDKLELTNVEKSENGGVCRISYHARMPVAWGNKHSIPESYTFQLPRDVSHAGQKSFLERYEHTCLDMHAHDVTAGIFWYYYRPSRMGCSLDDADVVRAQAAVHTSPIGTSGKYPEYHEVWKDDVFEVVAVFGKYEDDATSGDAGISAWNAFNRNVKNTLQGQDLVTEPAEIPYSPGVDIPETSFVATLQGGRTVRIRGFLIDSVGSAPSSFWEKYESLTPSADFIVYNGHAGLGANIRKMARKGSWKSGQYAIVFMNGCDTYAYVDSALADAHAAVNPDDPEGTKYLDVMANAMPSFFRSMPYATTAMIEGLMDYESPRTYEQIFQNIDSSEVVLVSGEHDNVYYPGYGDDPGGDDPPPVEDWPGMNEQGTVVADQESRFETPMLPAGRYEFSMSGSGDADLYVRIGQAPTGDLYDCRPYLEGSQEVCEVALEVAAPVHAMVLGWADSSDFQLVGERVE